MIRKSGFKRKRPTKIKAKHTPKIKKVKLPKAHVLHVEVPPEHVPVFVPGPVPNVMRIVPVPANKPQSWMDYFFGTERK